MDGQGSLLRAQNSSLTKNCSQCPVPESFADKEGSKFQDDWVTMNLAYFRHTTYISVHKLTK